MSEDAELLHTYAETGSEAAFAALVGRHLDLVYGSALRRTGDPHRAAEVAQAVFTALARDARKLSRHPVLAAWLHTATRNAALNLMISEQRRAAREREAAARAAGADSPDWERLAPLLDDAIDQLPGPDREAVVLRFLERRDFPEIGRQLRISADAARMRTGRALDRLRRILERRGITSTAAALGAAVAAPPLLPAPAGLAQTVAAAALAGAGPALGLGGAVTTLMTTKTTVTVIGCALLAYGAGAYFGWGARPSPAPRATLAPSAEERTIASLRQTNRTLQADLDRVDAANIQLNARLAQLQAAADAGPRAGAGRAASGAPRNLSLGFSPRELKLGILSNLRQIAAARDQYRLQNGASPASVDALVGDGGYIRRLGTVGGEDYSGLDLGSGGPLTVTTPDGTAVTFDPSGPGTTPIDPPTAAEAAQETMQKLGPAVGAAFAAYKAANQGQPPPDPEALTPYFANPEDAVAFAQARAALAAAHPAH